MFSQEPPAEVRQISTPSVRIERFESLPLAEASCTRRSGTMVIKEAGKNIWYVMPEFNGTKQFSTMEED